MTTPKKIAQKKPLPKTVKEIRMVLLGNVCSEWDARIRKARTIAACRKIWEKADDSARHSALLHAGSDALPFAVCLGCSIGYEKRAAMTFEEYLTHVRAKAKEIRAKRAAKAAAKRAEKRAA